MSAALTIADIHAAKANDLTAYGKVNSATEDRVLNLAHRHASKMGTVATGSDRYQEYLSEYMQVARIAVWEALSTFEGATVEEFFKYSYGTADAKLRDAARAERGNGGTGVERDTMAHFAKALRDADGDPYLAEKIARETPYNKSANGGKGITMSADIIHAARLMYQGTAALDKPATDEGTDLADTISTEDDKSYEVTRRSRPDMFQRAARALDDYLPAPRDAHLREAVCISIGNAFRGTVLLSDVELLEDLPTPKNDIARKQVTAALGILRGLVEQQEIADELPEEMRTPHERAHAAKRETAKKVHTVLNSLGDRQRDVLVGIFGISLPDVAVPYFGIRPVQREYDREGLAGFLGITPRNVTDAANKAWGSAGRPETGAFGKRWIAAEAGTSVKAANGKAGA